MYKMSEVAAHSTKNSRVWVTFDGNVYDITDFVDSHPGGKIILAAAGGSVDPFWNLYQVHKTKVVQEMLEAMKIGVVDPDDVVEVDDADPFSTDPKRHPALIIVSKNPFNAESPPEMLNAQFNTPNELFFVRNHLPVPDVEINSYRLEIVGPEKGLKKKVDLFFFGRIEKKF